MTRLSERIEAAEPGTDLTELGAEMLTFVTGDEHTATPLGLCAFNKDGYAAGTPINPLTDLNAIAALEREYAEPSGLFIQVKRLAKGGYIAGYPIPGKGIDVLFDDYMGRAPTEPLARSAALVRALEVIRDV